MIKNCQYSDCEYHFYIFQKTPKTVNWCVSQFVRGGYLFLTIIFVWINLIYHSLPTSLNFSLYIHVNTVGFFCKKW